MDELLDFTGKVALITGAGGGFGRLLAQGLAKRGCKLVISDINQQNLDETLASLPDQNNAISMLCDVSKEQDYVILCLFSRHEAVVEEQCKSKFCRFS